MSEQTSQIKRPKMPLEQRAKQFMPFMPLQDYPIALRERELKVEAEMELEHESLEETEVNTIDLSA